MLKINVKKHCMLRNATDTNDFLRKHGFTHWRINKLNSDKMKSITFAELEKLCTVFRCTPNDLFEWLPEKAEANGHPLTPLLPEKPNILPIENLSYAQLKDIAKIVNEKG
jgi:DNA-binding Xre family transcriptional regulator